MTKYVILVYVAVLLFCPDDLVNAGELQCPNNLTATSTLRRLKKNLSCGYDRMVRPVHRHTDAVNVKLTLIMKRIDFNERNDSLTVHSWFVMEWTDYHLVWDPAKYGNLQDFSMESYYLWEPDIGLLNAYDEKGFKSYMPFTKCELWWTGEVMCVPSVNHVASCSADLTRWPYDVHKCDMIFGSWTYTLEQINISLGDMSYWSSSEQNESFSENREWSLISMNSYRFIVNIRSINSSFPTVRYEFVLERNSGVYTATIIFPAVVLMILTLATFWMEVKYFDRLVLASILVFSHFIFLQYLGNILPSNGDKTPLIVTFYRDSSFLATTALLITVTVRSLRKTSRALPAWLSGISTLVLQNRLGQVLLYRNLDSKDAATISETTRVEGEETEEGPAVAISTVDWDTFITILDFFGFLVTFFIYVILLLGFIP